MANTGGITTVAIWMIDALCRSSKSSVCEAAPLQNAAFSAFACSPCPLNTLASCSLPVSKVCRRSCAGFSWLPRMHTPSQSRIHCFVLRTVAGGKSSNRRSAANAASSFVAILASSLSFSELIAALILTEYLFHDAADFAERRVGLDRLDEMRHEIVRPLAGCLKLGQCRRNGRRIAFLLDCIRMRDLPLCHAEIRHDIILLADVLIVGIFVHADHNALAALNFLLVLISMRGHLRLHVA